MDIGAETIRMTWGLWLRPQGAASRMGAIVRYEVTRMLEHPDRDGDREVCSRKGMRDGVRDLKR